MSRTEAGQQLTGQGNQDTSTNRYAGTAEAYERYRVPYPAELLDDLRHRASVTGQGKLLDLACGPGRVALPLAGFFSEVWAVDQEPEMVKVGSARARRQGLSNIRWMVGRAEELVASPGSFELVTIGEAFHRLDQRLIAERVIEWLAPGHGLATLGCFSLMQGREPWHDILRTVVRRWRSDGSTVATSARPPSRSRGSDHDRKVLTMFGFEDMGAYDFSHPYVWTLDSILGNLRSTSRLSRRALGLEAEQFESDLRRELLAHDSSGRYRETLRFGYSLLKKPGDCGEAGRGITQPGRRLPL